MADGQEKKEQQKGTLLTIINPMTGAGTVKSNFTKVPNTIIDDKSLNLRDKMLYIMLLRLPYQKRKSARDSILISHEYLCRLAGVKERKTITESLNRLEAAGYCKRLKITGQLVKLFLIIKPSVTEEQKQNIEDMINEMISEMTSDVSA